MAQKYQRLVANGTARTGPAKSLHAGRVACGVWNLKIQTTQAPTFSVAACKCSREPSRIRNSRSVNRAAGCGGASPEPQVSVVDAVIAEIQWTQG